MLSLRHCWIVPTALLMLGACATPPASERLQTACAAGDEVSCDAVEATQTAQVGQEPPDDVEPEVREASDPLLRDPRVSIGVSSNGGVGVGVGFGLGSRIGVGVGRSGRYDRWGTGSHIGIGF